MAKVIAHWKARRIRAAVIRVLLFSLGTALFFGGQPMLTLAGVPAKIIEGTPGHMWPVHNSELIMCIRVAPAIVGAILMVWAWVGVGLRENAKNEGRT